MLRTSPTFNMNSLMDSLLGKLCSAPASPRTDSRLGFHDSGFLPEHFSMAPGFLTKLPLSRPLLRPCGSLQFCSGSSSPRFSFHSTSSWLRTLLALASFRRPSARIGLVSDSARGTQWLSRSSPGSSSASDSGFVTTSSRGHLFSPSLSRRLPGSSPPSFLPRVGCRTCPCRPRASASTSALSIHVDLIRVGLGVPPRIGPHSSFALARTALLAPVRAPPWEVPLRPLLRLRFRLEPASTSSWPRTPFASVSGYAPPWVIPLRLPLRLVQASGLRASAMAPGLQIPAPVHGFVAADFRSFLFHGLQPAPATTSLSSTWLLY